MRHLSAVTAVLALSLGATPAFAGGWSDFVSSFPVSPCQDGWLGCIVGGEAVGPNLGRDQTGAPAPADLRVGWFDLEGLPGFSPFPELSPYSGRAPAPPADDAVAEVADDDGPAPAPARDDRPSPGGGGDTPRSADRAPSGDGGDRSGSRGASDPDRTVRSGGRGDAPATGGDGGTSISDLGRESAGSASGTADAGDATESMVKNEAAPPPADSGDCSNIKKLEPMAMLGKLSDAQRTCIEAQIASSAKQTDKDKYSRVLMSNAWASGDKKQWEKLVKRHLDEIDRSDPDLCYKYAMHLARKGPGAANAVIRWSDIALENKTVWTGPTYTNRVFNLLKLRAASAQALWKSAEDKYAADASDAARAERDNYRNRTKVLAREWYEYAKSAGKSADQARALCMAAAGTEDYCEGA